MIFACSFTESAGRVRVGKRTYHFEFSPLFGPLVLRSDGMPYEKQPTSPAFWDAFERWLREKEADR